MKKRSKGKIALFFLFFFAAFCLVSLLFNLEMIIKSEESISFTLLLNAIISNKLILPTIVLSLAAGAIGVLLIDQGKDLNNINLIRTGNSQYGDSRFANQKETTKLYKTVSFNKETIPGVVIKYNKTMWKIDDSDQNLLLVSPPGGGKTKRVYIPSIYYNAMVNKNNPEKSASLLITDAKGELLASCGKFLKENGYNVLVLDFRHPMESYCYNLMNNVNIFMDKFKNAKTSEEKILNKAAAEKYAKILASSIVDNTQGMASETAKFFNETAKGLVTSLVLLVSEHAEENERHIISVFRLIVELNGLTEDSTDMLQKNKLAKLLEFLPDDDRIKLFAGASVSADVRTSMNIFSSALGKLVSFIDGELEQLICNHSDELNAQSFIDKPTAIFLIVPDEDSTRHFFASLFIRNIMNELIYIAEERETKELQRRVIAFWDEFGQIPAIKDIDMLFTACRSRGIRFIVALQSLSQLEDNYSKSKSNIIKDACQMTMFSYVAPTAYETARSFSQALGTYTTQSGSVSSGEKNKSSSKQLIKRQLMFENEIISMPPGELIVMKSGNLPIKTKLPLYFEIFKTIHMENFYVNHNKVITIQYFNTDKFIRKMSAPSKIDKNMFDDYDY